MYSRAPLAAIFVLVFIIDSAKSSTQTANVEVARKNENSLYSLIEDKLEIKVGELINYCTRYLEDFNDKHLGVTELGRLLHYDEIKPKLDKESARSKPSAAGRMKKMAMAMMPLVFHVGATSTFMILTSIMAVKSVMIGLALLVFKIAVSSAKLAAFFTQLKGKHHEDHHHGWSWSPPPHHEYHGHDRSFSDIEHKPEHHNTHIDHQTDHGADWHSYAPEWTPNDAPTDYHTLPTGAGYKHADIPLESEKHEEYNGPFLHAEDRKKVAEKKKFT